MISFKYFSINNFCVLYLIVFITIGLLVNFSSYLGYLVSLLGQILVLSFISWEITKKFRKFRNKELISSFNRAVVVTGCDTGFGNALAHKLNEHGFRVYATVLDPECIGAKNLIIEAQFKGKTKVMRMDVTNDEEVNDVYQQIKTDLLNNGEELWAVVNNAGIALLGQTDWGTIDGYKRVFDVNTFGTVRVTRQFLPLIRKSKGRIVNVASIVGRITLDLVVNYSMSKYAVISFSDGLRRENKKFGIKVSTVEPMAFKTSISSDENFLRILDKQWNESSDDVKQLYGTEFLQYIKAVSVQTQGTIYEQSDKVYLVIDALLDAIRNIEPEISYQVFPNLLMKISTKLLIFLPDQITDFLHYYITVIKKLPAALLNEE